MRMRFGSLMAALGLSLILGTQSAPAQPSSEPTDSRRIKALASGTAATMPSIEPTSWTVTTRQRRKVCDRQRTPGRGMPLSAPLIRWLCAARDARLNA